LAKKDNQNARQIDLTSFEFVRACGACHPGGGPAEYDRTGARYDAYAADPANHIEPGGENGFDGDYFRSRWRETGVLEADCLLCHMPSYDHGARNAQIAMLNFKWAATAGAGFARVTGGVADGRVPKTSYDRTVFLPDGTVALHLVREVPSRNCLSCHREPDWKKKGASYSTRTDVHLRAGLRCVDCHVTGRKAADTRIRGREIHETGKGDDPTGLVRDDLDNTMRTCRDCHMEGLLKAPVPLHRGLPPRHLEKIACQTCHIPQRQVKAALLQDSTVFNTTPRITASGKRIWTFYGPAMEPWNLYGEASAFTAERQPLHVYEPVRAWYKGRIHPLNRIYSIWVGLLAEDGKTLHQPFMKDLFMMWKSHLEDPVRRYPELALIRDDNADGAQEIDRPEEIRGFLKAVTEHLRAQGEPLEERRAVLVSGPEYTSDGAAWNPLPFAPQPWEYTPYASVFKLNHDIAPAAQALGTGGCTDCHGSSAGFWTRPVMARPFTGVDAQPVFVENAALLGLSPVGTAMSGFRHEILIPVLFYGVFGAFACLVLVLVAYGLGVHRGVGETFTTDPEMRLHLGIIGVALLGPAVLLVGEALLSSEIIGVLGRLHTAVGILFVLAVLRAGAGSRRPRGANVVSAAAGILFMAATGSLLLVADSMEIRQIVFTFHDIGAVTLCSLAGLLIVAKIFRGARR